jgi:cytochrome c-type biogenesis protein CcmE
MRRSASPVRLVLALSVASVLGVFLLYTSLAGGATPSITPSQLAGHAGEVNLVGLVLGPVRGDAHASGLRFRLRDIEGQTAVRVVYRGSVPDMFKVGRHVFVRGTMRGSVFVAVPGSLVTKCPSKYEPSKNGSS